MLEILTRADLHQQQAPEIRTSHPLPASEAAAVKVPILDPDQYPILGSQVPVAGEE